VVEGVICPTDGSESLSNTCIEGHIADPVTTVVSVDSLATGAITRIGRCGRGFCGGIVLPSSTRIRRWGCGLPSCSIRASSSTGPTRCNHLAEALYLAVHTLLTDLELVSSFMGPVGQDLSGEGESLARRQSSGVTTVEQHRWYFPSLKIAHQSGAMEVGE
jgi:hypothetical protein